LAFSFEEAPCGSTGFFTSIEGVNHMADTKLQDIIETLKKQGVESGEKAGQEIIDSARKQAGDILSQARAEASSIVAQAKEESEKQTKRLQSSMEIAASQFVNNLKGVIEENLLKIPLKKELTGVLSDPGFMKSLLTRFVESYAAGSQGGDIQVLIPKEIQDQLRDYAIELMARHYGHGKGGDQLVLELDAQDVKCGFQVNKKNGNVRLDFSDEAFLSLFLGFLSPKFRDLFKNIKIGDLSKK
jgi:V/A-type H+/Na+-transporting ATPase subunit E